MKSSKDGNSNVSISYHSKSKKSVGNLTARYKYTFDPNDKVDVLGQKRNTVKTLPILNLIFSFQFRFSRLFCFMIVSKAQNCNGDLVCLSALKNGISRAGQLQFHFFVPSRHCDARVRVTRREENFCNSFLLNRALRLSYLILSSMRRIFVRFSIPIDLALESEAE